MNIKKEEEELCWRFPSHLIKPFALFEQLSYSNRRGESKNKKK